MSVLTYIYPREPQRLELDSLLSSLSRESDGFTVVTSEKKTPAISSWSYLLLAHDSFKHLQFAFVVAQNNKSNIEWVGERHAKSRNLDVVRNAKKYIWSEIITGNASDRELNAGFASFHLIIYTLARLSKGVVDLPENEKLYSSTGFARYREKTAEPAGDPGGRKGGQVQNGT